MVAEIDYKKCTLCGWYNQPVCIDRCPDGAISLKDGKIIIRGVLCEDCNECGFACPDKAIKIRKVTF